MSYNDQLSDNLKFEFTMFENSIWLAWLLRTMWVTSEDITNHMALISAWYTKESLMAMIIFVLWQYTICWQDMFAQKILDVIDNGIDLPDTLTEKEYEIQQIIKSLNDIIK